MTAEIIPIEVGMKDHITIQGINGTIYVTPIEAYRRIASGDIPLKDLGDFEFIVPAIIQEWLVCVVYDDGNEN